MHTRTPGTVSSALNLLLTSDNGTHAETQVMVSPPTPVAVTFLSYIQETEAQT